MAPLCFSNNHLQLIDFSRELVNSPEDEERQLDIEVGELATWPAGVSCFLALLASKDLRPSKHFEGLNSSTLKSKTWVLWVVTLMERGAPPGISRAEEHANSWHWPICCHFPRRFLSAPHRARALLIAWRFHIVLTATSSSVCLVLGPLGEPMAEDDKEKAESKYKCRDTFMFVYHSNKFTFIISSPIFQTPNK